MGLPAWAVQLIITVIASAVSYITRPDTSLDELAGDQDAKANTRGTDQFLRIHYGRNKVGGNDVYINTLGVPRSLGCSNSR